MLYGSDAETLKNKTASMVRSDPSSLDAAMKMVDSSVGAMADSSPALTFNERFEAKTKLAQHMKEEIVHSWVDGASSKNPAAAEAAINSGKFDQYIDRPTANKIIKMNRIVNDTDKNTAAQREEWRQSLAYRSGVSKIFQDAAPDTADGKWNIPEDAGKQIKDLATRFPMGAAKNDESIPIILNKMKILGTRRTMPVPVKLPDTGLIASDKNEAAQ